VVFKLLLLLSQQCTPSYTTDAERQAALHQTCLGVGCGVKVFHTLAQLQSHDGVPTNTQGKLLPACRLSFFFPACSLLVGVLQAYREWDFSNMLTVLLRFNGRAVAAAVVRVFGSQLAELPLVATRPDARRQGHARVLVRAIEATLNELGVEVGCCCCCCCCLVDPGGICVLIGWNEVLLPGSWSVGIRQRDSSTVAACAQLLSRCRQESPV
jgi:GNAT superfamily N-acetyltransferase